MTTTPPAIASLPAPPNPADRSTFNTLAYPWSAALPAFGASVSAVADNVKLNADEGALSATAAAAQALIATLQANAAAGSAITAGAVAWVSGTTYAIGNARYSPNNGQTYRRITAGAGTTDPSADATNWVIVNGLVNQAVSIPVNNLPGIRPSLDLDFANSQTVDPRITFTRASAATVTNSKGLIAAVLSGVPRIDFDPVTGACKSLLIEEQRANLLTYSEQFDNTAWTKTRATVTANATTAPDGALTADKLVDDSTSSNNHYIEQNATATTANPYTLTVFVKPDSRTYVNLRILEGSPFARSTNVNFDLSAATVGTKTDVGGASASSASIVSVGGGWFRCSLTTTLGGSATSILAGVFLSSAGGTAYTGDGTSGLFIWGTQLEAGALPTSYTPTVASQVTRVADVATMTGANFSSWYRQDEFSAALQIIGRSSGTVVYASWSDATANEVIKLESISGALTLSIIDGGVTQAALSLGSVVTGVSYKIAAAWKLNDIAASINGAAVATDTTSTIPTVTQLGIASSLAFLTGYPKRLTNAELQALSTQ